MPQEINAFDEVIALIKQHQGPNNFTHLSSANFKTYLHNEIHNFELIHDQEINPESVLGMIHAHLCHPQPRAEHDEADEADSDEEQYESIDDVISTLRSALFRQTNVNEPRNLGSSFQTLEIEGALRRRSMFDLGQQIARAVAEAEAVLVRAENLPAVTRRPEQAPALTLPPPANPRSADPSEEDSSGIDTPQAPPVTPNSIFHLLFSTPSSPGSSSNRADSSGSDSSFQPT